MLKYTNIIINVKSDKKESDNLYRCDLNYECSLIELQYMKQTTTPCEWNFTSFFIFYMKHT